VGIWCIGFIARLLQCAGVRSVFGLTGAPGHVPGRDQGAGRFRWFSISHPGAGKHTKKCGKPMSGFYTSTLYSFQEGMKRQKWDINPQTCIYHYYYPTETITKPWKWMSSHQSMRWWHVLTKIFDMDQATYRRQGTTDGLLMRKKQMS